MKIKFFPFYGLSILPMGILYLFSDFIFFITYHIVKYRRNVVAENLKRAFPDKSEQELKNIEKNFYRHFSDVLFETIKVLTIRKKEIEKRIHFTNLEVIDRYYQKNKNVVMYAAHFGNWEWLSYMQLYVPYKGLTIYQPLSNKYFDELMRTIRERFGATCVETAKSYRTILKYIQKDELTLTAIIGDQSPSGEGAKCWVNFLNQETAFLRGAEVVVERTNQQAIFPVFRKRSRGVYDVEFKVLDTSQKADNDYQLIEQYAKALESAIKDSPEMWLWSHRRWKLSRTA